MRSRQPSADFPPDDKRRSVPEALGHGGNVLPPPPASPVLLSRGSYSSVLNSNSELNQKKAPGNKLSPATPLPGKNGNPTFAAVAAGYDKSPGGSGPGKTDKSLAHMASVESDGSDSSGLWSPLETASSPNFHSANSFSAFGPNNSFNLTGVFSGMNLPKPTEPQPQQSWPEFSSASSIWDVPTSDSLHSWPSSSPTAPTASLLGNARSLWSAPTPFSSSIWSTSADSALHPFPPASSSSSTLTDLVSPVAPSPPPLRDEPHLQPVEHVAPDTEPPQLRALAQLLGQQQQQRQQLNNT
ncbi:hypothetical protein CesoFtcFv8_005522 [Champsocephalus esox]|uniref:Uncharacterized protein n=1 Tax=Champsocephalus esox TaxID=159716 RepID=A0AAN8HA40_9TELE|nr:hypothetical protein CesoFtcFv8_005522 [Champsocephalus esox]